MSQNKSWDTRTVLLGAAQIMRERGLARGFFMGSSGQVCTRGAIMRCLAESGLPEFQLTGTPWFDRIENAESKVRTILESAYPELKNARLEIISSWNDRYCQSAEEAAKLLDRAAGVQDDASLS